MTEYVVYPVDKDTKPYIGYTEGSIYDAASEVMMHLCNHSFVRVTLSLPILDQEYHGQDPTTYPHFEVFEECDLEPDEDKWIDRYLIVIHEYGLQLKLKENEHFTRIPLRSGFKIVGPVVLYRLVNGERGCVTLPVDPNVLRDKLHLEEPDFVTPKESPACSHRRPSSPCKASVYHDSTTDSSPACNHDYTDMN